MKSLLKVIFAPLMFIAALFTVAKTWKLPKCLSTGECIKQSVMYIYNRILFRHNREGNLAIFYNMDES